MEATFSSLQCGGSWFHLDATQDVGRDHSRISPNLLPRSSSNDFKNLPQPASKVGAYGQGRGYDRGYGGGRFGGRAVIAA